MRNYKKSKRKGFQLEEYIAEKLRKIDPNAKPTKNSGASGSIGDVANKHFYIEAKQRLTKDNIIMQYKKEWGKLNKEIPVGSMKIPIFVTENRVKDKFVIINAEDFFRLMEEVYEKND